MIDAHERPESGRRQIPVKAENHGAAYAQVPANRAEGQRLRSTRRPGQEIAAASRPYGRKAAVSTSCEKRRLPLGRHVGAVRHQRPWLAAVRERQHSICLSRDPAGCRQGGPASLLLVSACFILHAFNGRPDDLVEHVLDAALLTSTQVLEPLVILGSHLEIESDRCPRCRGRLRRRGLLLLRNGGSLVAEPVDPFLQLTTGWSAPKISWPRVRSAVVRTILSTARWVSFTMTQRTRSCRWVWKRSSPAGKEA